MVIRETKRSNVIFIPECTCNKKLNHVIWRGNRHDENLDELKSHAEDHEEMHDLARGIVNYIARTGKMGKEDVLLAMPKYSEGVLSIAANLAMYPVVFPKRRHVPFQEFVKLKQHMYQMTEEFRRQKYAPVNDEEETLILEE